jgi:transposase
MSWLAGLLFSTRERLGLASLQERDPFAQFCHRFSIARSTGCKWLHRFRRHGRADLENSPAEQPS